MRWLFAITTNSRFSHACVLDANGSTIIESFSKVWWNHHSTS